MLLNFNRGQKTTPTPAATLGCRSCHLTAITHGLLIIYDITSIIKQYLDILNDLFDGDRIHAGKSA